MSSTEGGVAAADQANPAEDDHRQALSVTIAALLTVLVVVLLAVVTVRLSNQTAHNRTAARAAYLAGPSALAAEAAAVRETRAALSYNYKTLPANFATAEAGLTPRFRANYLSTTAASVTPLARKYHAISTATVTAGGVSQSGPTAATVLLFVDQTVENSRLAHPRLDQSRIKVSMLKLNGRWVIDDLSPI
jgi:Mce-associated membrane protein